MHFILLMDVLYVSHFVPVMKEARFRVFLTEIRG